MTTWNNPLPFVTYLDNKFLLNHETVRKLKKIDKPLSIVCIAGRLRSGKSYLMNRLMGKSIGFPLGSTIEAVTKGIWIWYTNHPRFKDKGLLLMDTEGLDDPDGSKREDYDMWILSLSILLSSTFIYNEIALIGNTIIERLGFVSELSKRIQYQSDNCRDAEFDGFFPNFVLAIRDVTLEIEIDGKDVTDDEYMERIMLTANKQAKKLGEKKLNVTKLKLRKYFPNRKCFTFASPIEGSKKKPENLADGDLPQEFVEKTKDFCSYIYEHSPVKKLSRTKEVTGLIFVQLATIYLSAINKNEIPCVESASNIIANNENAKAIDSSLEKYREIMYTLQFPVDKVPLETTHMCAQEAAVVHFLQKSFLDKDNVYYETLQVRLTNEYLVNVKNNLILSRQKCASVLEELFKPIIEKLNSATYITEGGLEIYKNDIEKLTRKYNDEPNKGAASNVTLEEFLLKRKTDEVFLIEHILTENERKAEKIRQNDQIEKMRLQLENDKTKGEKETADVITRTFHEQTKIFNAIKEKTCSQIKESYDEQFSKRQKEIKRLKKENFLDLAIKLRIETRSLTGYYQDFLERSTERLRLTTDRVERMLLLTIEAIKSKLREIIYGECERIPQDFSLGNPFIAL